MFHFPRTTYYIKFFHIWFYVCRLNKSFEIQLHPLRTFLVRRLISCIRHAEVVPQTLKHFCRHFLSPRDPNSRSQASSILDAVWAAKYFHIEKNVTSTPFSFTNFSASPWTSHSCQFSVFLRICCRFFDVVVHLWPQIERHVELWNWTID